MQQNRVLTDEETKQLAELFSRKQSLNKRFMECIARKELNKANSVLSLEIGTTNTIQKVLEGDTEGETDGN